MENLKILPKFLQKRLQKLGYNCQKVTSPAPNAYCVELLPTTPNTTPNTDIPSASTSLNTMNNENLKTIKKVFIKCLATVEDDARDETTRQTKTSENSNTNSYEFEADLYFANETTFYSRLLSNFADLEKTFRSSINVPFSSVPSCVYADTSCLILEDLFSDGYVPADINTPLNYERTRVVLQQLGRFHAFSIALQHHDTELFNHIIEDLNPTDETTRTIFLEGLQDGLKLAKNSFTKNSIYVEKLTFFIFDIYKDYRPIDGARDKDDQKLTAPSCDDGNVITHGDLWPNNILLKFNEGRVQSAKFVDFQGCRYASWVYDLMAVILIAVDKPTRDKHLHELLECYRLSVCLKLEELDLNEEFIENVFSVQNFGGKLKMNARYAMAMALAGLPLYLQGKQERHSEGFDVGELGVDPVVGYFRGLRARKGMKCKNKMLEIIMDVVDYGYLNSG